MMTHSVIMPGVTVGENAKVEGTVVRKGRWSGKDSGQWSGVGGQGRTVVKRESTVRGFRSGTI